MAQEALKPTWGQKICDRRGWAFGELFRHQFRIARTARINNPEWTCQHLGSIVIERCQHLPLTEIHNRKGVQIGVILGFAVARDGQVIGSNSGKPIVISAHFDAVERLQRRLAGRFLILCEIDGEARLYPDACASLTYVVNTREHAVASTVPLATGEKVPRKSPKYQFMGATCVSGINQAFANHYVQMHDLSFHRFWPKADTRFDFFQQAEFEDQTRQLADRLLMNVSTLCRAFSVALPITGGRDSRMLVGASMSVREEVDSYYVHEINWSSGFDVTSAKTVAAHLRLPLDIRSGVDDLSRGREARIQRARAALATGYSVPQMARTVLAALRLMPGTDLLLRGGAGEIGRASRWLTPVTTETPSIDQAFRQYVRKTPEELSAEMGEDAVQCLRELYADWADKLPSGRHLIHDLSYLELWMSGQAGAFYYASEGPFLINPFGDADLLHRMMRFPPVYRKRGLLVARLLEKLVPGLSELPFTPDLIRAGRRGSTRRCDAVEHY